MRDVMENRVFRLGALPRAKLRLSRVLSRFAALPLLVSCSASALPDQPSIAIEAPEAVAFPAAIGFGASSRGGQGGRIIPVTTLANKGSGSFRECVEAEGPRVCVFRVDGVIRFTEPPPVISNAHLTIAGQTAPGVGITLSHAGAPHGRTPLVIKGTHDVVIRHIRVRLDRNGGDRRAEDAITIEDSFDVVIDHVSASGARDEVINGFSQNDRITISNSIFAYGVPRHDKCALLASDPKDKQNFSFIGNICAHNGDRNPDVNFPRGSCVEVLNNVFYNAQSEFAEVWEGAGGTPVSIVGNSFIAGPDTRHWTVGVENDSRGSTGRGLIYLAGNRFQGRFRKISRRAQEILSDEPPCSFTITPIGAEEAYEKAFATAGAFPRDALCASRCGRAPAHRSASGWMQSRARP